jgi:hypothetical protein
MITYDEVGFVIIAVLAMFVTALVVIRGRQPFPGRLLLLAVALRILGSFARYEVLVRFYNGVSDAVGYYSHGYIFAQRLWDRDLSVLGIEQWLGGGKWWGTLFVNNLSGLVISIIGPTMRGEFLVFSLMGFVGLYLAARALLNLSPRPVVVRYATWIWVWPSLWFWPSSVGKEAVIVLATGILLFGYAGRSGSIRWGPYLAGVLLALAIRPHYAAFLVLVTGVTHWLGSWEGRSPRRLVEAGVVVLVAVMALVAMTSMFGVESADLEGMQELLVFRGQKTLIGGSNLGSLPSGVTGVPLAFVNIWMRPFPWEAHNLTALLSMAELLVLWTLVWRYRKSLLSVPKCWRTHRFLRFATVTVVGYTLLIGYTFGNLGIIARQRTPMFIFVFMVFATASLPVAVRKLEPSIRRASWAEPGRRRHPVLRNPYLPSRTSMRYARSAGNWRSVRANQRADSGHG